MKNVPVTPTSTLQWEGFLVKEKMPKKRGRASSGEASSDESNRPAKKKTKPAKKVAPKKATAKKAAPKKAKNTADDGNEGDMTPAEKRAETIALRAALKKEDGKRPAPMATAETRLTAFKKFDGVAAKDFEVREVGTLPFEQKRAAMKEGRREEDECLYCTKCKERVKHGESIQIKSHCQNKKHIAQVETPKATSTSAPAAAPGRQSVLPVISTAFIMAWALALCCSGVTPTQAGILGIPIKMFVGKIPEPKALLGKSSEFLEATEQAIIEIVRGRPIPLAIDGTGLRHLGFAILTIAAVVSGQLVLLHSDIRDDGNCHTAEDVTNAIALVRERFLLLKTTVVADRGSVNVAGLSGEGDVIWCFGHVLNAALRVYLKAKYPSAYQINTLFSQCMACKSRRRRWKALQKAHHDQSRTATDNLEDLRIRVQAALDKKSLRGLSRLLPNAHVDDTAEMLLAKGKEFVAEHIDVDTANMEVATPRTPPLTSDTRWLAMVEVAVHLRDRKDSIPGFLHAETGRKKKPQTVLLLADLVKKGEWNTMMEEVCLDMFTQCT